MYVQFFSKFVSMSAKKTIKYQTQIKKRELFKSHEHSKAAEIFLLVIPKVQTFFNPLISNSRFIYIEEGYIKLFLKCSNYSQS